MPLLTSLIIGLMPFRPTATEDSPVITTLLCFLPPLVLQLSQPRRQPVTPAGGPPGDEGPSDDPGDDLNNPDFYNDDLDDDDFPPHADPTLIILNNLAGAVSLLACNSRRANKSLSQT